MKEKAFITDFRKVRDTIKRSSGGLEAVESSAGVSRKEEGWRGEVVGNTYVLCVCMNI